MVHEKGHKKCAGEAGGKARFEGWQGGTPAAGARLAGSRGIDRHGDDRGGPAQGGTARNNLAVCAALALPKSD